jgi:hypothetical protein
LTNRWTPAKSNAVFSYDAAGNLIGIIYASSPSNHSTCDALNRPSTMADAVGSTVYAYTRGGFLQSEDGPWDNDTVSYSYTNRLRSGKKDWHPFLQTKMRVTSVRSALLRIMKSFEKLAFLTG